MEGDHTQKLVFTYNFQSRKLSWYSTGMTVIYSIRKIKIAY